MTDAAEPSADAAEATIDQEESEVAPDVLSQIMEISAIDQLTDDLFKTMMRELVNKQMFREADMLEAKFMELQHADAV